MTARLELADLKVMPWQVPPLDQSGCDQPPPVAEHAAIPADRAESESSAMNGATEGAREVLVETPPADEAQVAEQRATGYAEGLELGLREGRVRGHAEGRREADQAAAAQAERLTTLLAELAGPLPGLESVVEEAVVALALEVARCVIGSEVKRSREPLIGLIRAAVAKVPIEMGAPQVMVNPADLALIRELMPELPTTGAALVADETIESGGCLVIANGDRPAVKDARWHPRAGEGVSQVDLTLAARWRNVMLTLFAGEEE